MRPELFLYNHQDVLPFHPTHWEKGINLALPHCLASILSPEAPLSSLEEVEFSFVDDAQISKIHDEFMADPSPTDVITFHHGEIHISLETAQRQSFVHGTAYDQEVILYMIHGLLHLAGWVDYEPEDRAAMHARQEAILQEVWSSIA